MKVKITEYKGEVVIETLDQKADDDFVPAGKGKIGCVLKNTGKHLGMSKEAWDIIKVMPISGDDLGEIMAWKTTDKINCFSWLGPTPGRLVPPTAELSYGGVDDIDFIKIPNETNPSIISKIKNFKLREENNN